MAYFHVLHDPSLNMVSNYSILIFSVGSYDAIFLGGDGPIKRGP
jgi:hypothetical protein